MIVICPDNPSRASARELQPFTRRETGRTWAFYHHGKLAKAAGLDVGGKIADSTSPSERYFLHLLTRLDPAMPVESITAALEAMAGEKTLSFCLVGSDLLVAGSWHDAASAGERSEHALWLGQGEMARYLTSQPLYSVPDTSWEQLSNRTVLALQRERRELP